MRENEDMSVTVRQFLKDSDKCHKTQRSKKKQHIQPLLFADFMPLMNTAFETGHCSEYLEEMEMGSKRDIALAEYYYFGRQPEKDIHGAAKTKYQTTKRSEKVYASIKEEVQGGGLPP